MAEPADDDIYAALDLGTNNCRLLIAYPSFRMTKNGRSLKAIDSFSRIVRLGEGVSSSDVLSEEAMERTIHALRTCQRKLERYALTRTRFVATEACRRAANAAEFTKRVQDELGLSLEIITNEEEARLALLGCCSLLQPGVQRALAFDIGGGSTEIMWVATPPAYYAQQPAQFPFHPDLMGWMSMPYGVMNLSEQFGHNEYASLYFEDIVAKVTERLAPFAKKHAISEILGDVPTQLLSTSGTVTTLAAVHMNLPRYDRSRVDGISLPAEKLRATIAQLLAMRPSERFNHPCIGPDRSDFIIAGCAILEALLRSFSFPQVTIADRGVREGIIISLMLREQDQQESAA
ncbi:MAG: Ppx/GppA family phosphatase [Rickettsiales bacterium]|nr:Ppx/GppA family phosphatase [Rickettsiales bacterium]